MKERLTEALGLFRPRGRKGGRLLALGLVLLGVLLVQTSSTGSRSSAQEATITFAVIGDYGSNDANEAAVANLVKSWNPSFIVTVGDNNYPDGEAATIDHTIGKYYHEYIHPYTGAYGAGATTNRFWPSVGNRDWENQTGARLSPYLNYFVLPGNERYYDFVQGPVHFFMLDSDSREPDGITSSSTQAQWLQVRLASSNAPWKVVVMHHPPYSSRTSWSNLQWPFKAWGADVVLSGHAHIYERILRDGFPYLICGLSGESLGSFSTAISGSMVRYGSDYGALKVTASSTDLTFRFITRTG
ncbi:MAG TPA: metallophosphoesterase, partial [Pyrinomonadaceae bacterium]|nr:metallophosphoesterase [Pyrinomonadaceae bacterium]